MPDADLLHWLPPSQKLAADLRAARVAEGAERGARFVAIANRRLGFLETLELDRAVQAAIVGQPAGLTKVKLALMGNSTPDHLLPAIRVAGLRFNLWIETYIGGYGQVRQELLNERSGLHQFRPDIVLLALDALHDTETVPLAASRGEVGSRLDGLVADAKSLWALVRDKLGATVIQQTALNIAPPIFGQHDLQVPAAPATMIAELNTAIRAAASDADVLLLDIARSSERLGTARWFDPARWHLAKQSIAPAIAPYYGDLVARLVASLRGLARKCLVVDLDNTLWGGVLGDDGLDGIVLGQGNAAGEAYQAFQRYLKSLTERGVLLAVCSKNDQETAEAAFRDHPEMVLRRDDIAVFVANWNDKPSNLLTIASRLNIGIDSLVFFDDSGFEREAVRQLLPMVAVPEVPEDPTDFVHCLADAGYFEAISFTDEDRARVRLYALDAEQQRARGSAANVEEFLSGLEMRMKVEPFAAADLNRVTQLINKTNQFNVTARRYTPEEVKALAADANVLTFQARLADRLAEHGLISVVILRQLRPGDPGSFVVDTWIMSCRVLGRQVEHALCNEVAKAALARGGSCIQGIFRPTAKNGLVRDLFPDLGFALAGADDPTSTSWDLLLHDFKPHATFIAVE